MFLAEGLRSLGLIGIFLASFLGHFSIVMKDVIFLPIFLYSSNFLDPVSLGLVAGLGGGLGEMGAYLIGRGVSKIRVKNKKPRQTPKWVKKLGLFSILVCSVTPIPDAPILLLIGTARFPILAVLALEIIGKIFLYTTAAIAGGILFTSLNSILPPPWDSILLIAVFISTGIIAASKRATAYILKPAQKIINKIRKLRKRTQD